MYLLLPYSIYCIVLIVFSVMSCATHCVEEEAFDDIQCFMVCASVIIFMRSVYTIAYFDTPISTGFLKVAVSCWFFESCFASY